MIKREFPRITSVSSDLEVHKFFNLEFMATQNWHPCQKICSLKSLQKLNNLHLFTLRGKLLKGKVKTNQRFLISHKLISYIHED
ncbi:unnamed protein product, partial [Vitis vinifera]|uniref:Uncharacterized protein n=1 Tax=Vitis vinifera TaxID=29760 RepID=D7SWR8_VITVI